MGIPASTCGTQLLTWRLDVQANQNKPMGSIAAPMIIGILNALLAGALGEIRHECLQSLFWYWSSVIFFHLTPTNVLKSVLQGNENFVYYFSLKRMAVTWLAAHAKGQW